MISKILSHFKKPKKRRTLFIKHDVLIADGKPNLNGRKYFMDSIEKPIPESVALFDSFDDNHRVIGRTSLIVEGNRIYGKSTITDSQIIEKLKTAMNPQYVVCQGFGDLSEENRVENFTLTNVAITDDPSDPRQKPIEVEDDKVT